jgi:predicted AAA+ superfamily ATPase
MQMQKDRYLFDLIAEMAFSGSKKMAFVTGPRQAGKTTLAQTFIEKRGRGAYYNWDQREFRALWAKTPQQILEIPGRDNNTTKPVVVLDEIHKAKLWKRTLKGIFDTVEKPTDFLVTGSARLDTFKKGSDSLLGRYFSFSLHPFSLAELLKSKFRLEDSDPDNVLKQIMDGPAPAGKNANEILALLLKFGGFPEPFLSQSERRARAWRQLRLQQLVREDLRDLTRLPELGNLEMLQALLPERVGSQLSRSSLREDLEVAYTTVSRWLSYFEAIFYHFEVKPYHRSIKRAIKKEGKLYLWDYAEVPTLGHKFENLVASHLLKACNYWTDAGYGKFQLSYLRDADHCEIDFLILKDNKPWLPIEVKLSEKTPSPHWKVFLPQLPLKLGIQVILDEKSYFCSHEISNKSVFVMDVARFLRLFV